MATAIRTSPAVTSITFSITGVVAGAAGVFSGITPAEASPCVQGFLLNGQPSLISSNPANGNCEISMPPTITSITINGHVYAVAGGKISAVVPVDANALLVGAAGQPFQLVTGA